MARYWENNGNPLPDGRYCYVIDPEDGTNALRTYGLTKDEVIDKAGKSLEHGQRLITQLRTARATTPAAPAPSAAPVPAPKSTKLSPDEIMTAAADISNPAKAADAVTKLVQHATGVDLKAQAARDAEIRMGNLAEAWQARHPEIEGSTRAEKRLLLMTAIQIAGTVANVTEASLEAALTSMLAQGYFSGEPDDEVEPEPQPSPTPTPTSATAGNGSPRTTVRPRGATSVRSSTLRGTAPTAPRNTAKYTRAQVDAMSADELAEKMQSEPGFAALVDQYARTPRRASA